MYLGERMLNNQRQERVDDPRYLKSFRDRVCEVCGSPNAIPAHIRAGHAGGTSYRPDDWKTLALCDAHHKEQENGGHEWLLRNILYPILWKRYQRWKGAR